MAETNSTKTIKTYNCKNVSITLGSHIVTGYADDSFFSYEALGDGVVAKYGCDGEVSRAIDPNDMYTVKLTIQQTSDTNDYLQKQYNLDRYDGTGLFPISVTDLANNSLFDASAAWVAKPSTKTYGKDTNNREWTIYAANVSVYEEYAYSSDTSETEE